MGYTFLQKPSSFKFLSILEENCVAHINNGAIKCKFLLTNVSQNGFWVSYTFLQKLSSFKFYSIFNSEFCIFPMNLVALTQNFQSRICFIAQATILNFDLIFFLIFIHVLLRLRSHYVHYVTTSA